MAEWINASDITSGYIFRRMASGDRPTAKDIPMVCLPLVLGFPSFFHTVSCSPPSSFWSFSVTIFLISELTTPHMALTPFDVADVSISLHSDTGLFVEFVSGPDGAQNFLV